MLQPHSRLKEALEAEYACDSDLEGLERELSSFLSQLAAKLVHWRERLEERESLCHTARCSLSYAWCY